MKISKTTLITLTIILVFLLVAVLVTFLVVKRHSERFNNEARLSLVGDKTNPAVYTDLRGNQVSLDAYTGKVLVINSWASWSPFSQTELPLLAEIAAEFPEVVFMAVNRQEPKEQAQRFLATLPSTDGVNIIIDTTDHFYTTIGGYTMPETIIYDKAGKVSTHIQATINPDELRDSINEALAES